ncbi:MAG TPA: DpnD protein [Lachnospiraceae bacterium]|nr:DpnD protein [Lachnospiraceae bacterium]
MTKNEKTEGIKQMTEKNESIRVVYCEPGKLARIKEIGTELENLQQAVGGGLIEPFYPFMEEVCIVCNDEGKFNGMRPCRAVYGEDGRVSDIIFGPFFICDCRTENFASLSDEQLKRFEKQFHYPEYFFRKDNEIAVVRYDPTKGRDQER